MEKVLIGAYLSVLAAFITSAASIVKLVNEKESKTTDYRQSWTDSVRNALSQLIGSISLQSSYLENRSMLFHSILKLHKEEPDPSDLSTKESVLSILKGNLTEVQTLARENRQNIQKYYALTTLHFKPHDEVFFKIEQKYEYVEDLLEKLNGADNPDDESARREIMEKVSSAVTELTNTSRYILKTEWENVKAGEPAYKKTKAWSLYIGIGTFAILVFGGIYMLAFAQAKSSVSTLPVPVSQQSSIAQPNLQQPPPVQQMVLIEANSCSTPASPIGRAKSIVRKPCDQKMESTSGVKHGGTPVGPVSGNGGTSGLTQ